MVEWPPLLSWAQLRTELRPWFDIQSFELQGDEGQGMLDAGSTRPIIFLYTCDYMILTTIYFCVGQDLESRDLPPVIWTGSPS